MKKNSNIRKKVRKHVMSDIRDYKEEIKKDRKLLGELKNPKKKEEKKKDPKKKDPKMPSHIKKAMKHKDILGAGAKKRASLSSKDKKKVVMEEFKRGTLRSGSGQKVTNPKQAVAIAYSEARRYGRKRRK